MNLLPYKIFIYLNYVLAFALVVFPWIFSAQITSNVVFSVLGFGLIALLASSQDLPVKKEQLLDPKIALLGLFIVAILLPFLHIVFNFTDNVPMIWSLYSISLLQLLSMLVVSFPEAKE